MISIFARMRTLLRSALVLAVAVCLCTPTTAAFAAPATLTVAGSVTSISTGQRIEGATVTVERLYVEPDSSWWAEVASGETGANGLFDLEYTEAVPAEYRVTARRGGYLMASQQISWNAVSTWRPALFLDDGPRLAGGRATAASDGAPVPHADVTAYRRTLVGDQRDWVLVGSGAADSSGRFLLEDYGAGPGDYRFDIRGANHAQVSVMRQWNGSGALSLGDVALPAPTAFVTGVILDAETGQPVEGAELYEPNEYYGPDGDGGGGPADFTTTDSSGRFILRDLLSLGAVAHEVFVSLDGYAPQHIEVPWDGGAPVELNIELEPMDVRLDSGARWYRVDTDRNRVAWAAEQGDQLYSVTLLDLDSSERFEVWAGSSSGMRVKLAGDWVALQWSDIEPDYAPHVYAKNIVTGAEYTLDNASLCTLGAGRLVYRGPNWDDPLTELDLESGESAFFQPGDQATATGPMDGNANTLAFIRKTADDVTQLVLRHLDGSEYVKSVPMPQWGGDAEYVTLGSTQVMASSSIDGWGHLFSTDDTDEIVSSPNDVQAADNGYVIRYGTLQRLDSPSFGILESVEALGDDWAVWVDPNDSNPVLKARRYDRVAPVTSPILSEQGWTNASAVTVRLNATDVSYVTRTRYGINNWADTDYDEPVAVTQEGITTVRFFSDDPWGNRERQRSVEVKIDRTAPSSTASASGGGSYSIEASDSLSPVQSVHWRFGRSGKWSTGSIATTSAAVECLQYYAVDAAGNAERVNELAIGTKDNSTGNSAPDTVTPTTFAVGAHSGWSNAPQWIWLLADEPGASTYYSVNDAAFARFIGPVNVDVEGTSTLRYYSVDAAGNVESTQTTLVRIDRTPPTIISDAKKTYDTSAAVHVSAQDGAAGVDRVLWRMDSGPWSTDPLLNTGEVGSHILECVAIDRAGNVSLPTTLRFSVRGESTLDFATSAAAITWGKTVALTGSLAVDGAAPVGRRVALEASVMGGPFVRVGSTYSGYDGSFVFSVSPTSSTLYRAVYDGDEDAIGAVSTARPVVPTAYVSNPIAPTIMYRGRAKTVYGFLKPQHTAGSKLVRIYKWRFEGGHWKAYGYSSTTCADYLDHSRYSAAVAIPATGRWRIRAFVPADDGHGAAWSTGYDYITVK